MEIKNLHTIKRVLFELEAMTIRVEQQEAEMNEFRVENKRFHDYMDKMVEKEEAKVMEEKYKIENMIRQQEYERQHRKQMHISNWFPWGK